MKFLKESATRKYGCLSTGPIGNAEKKKKVFLVCSYVSNL